MASDLDFSKKVILNSDILEKQVDDSLILCNLNNETFYKLDAFSKKIYDTVLKSESIDGAFDRLYDQYDVESDILRSDLENLVNNLLSEEIVKLS